MILFCHRQNALVSVRVEATDTWVFSACYEHFEKLMREYDNRWSIGIGERFVIDLKASDVTDKYNDLIAKTRRADVLNRKAAKMATGKGGTKQDLMIGAHAVFLVVGIGGTLFFHDTQILIHTIKALGLIGAMFALSYGIGKGSWNIRQGICKKDID